MGKVADFSKYKARRDYDRQLLDKGWAATRLTTETENGTSIYVYDDTSHLLLFSVIEQNSLLDIRQRVGSANKEDMLLLAEKLNLLILDLADDPPIKNDIRLSSLAHTSAWFTGFIMSMVSKPDLDDKSIALLRLHNDQTMESVFHLVYLDWPDIKARTQAEQELADLAELMRNDLIQTTGL